MSHHLDSPLARQDIRLDIADMYVFRGRRGTVFVMDVGHSIAEQDVTGFHPEAMYEFKIDGTGDAVEDLTYRLTFGEQDRAGRQHLRLRRLTGAEAADPHATGTVIAEGGTGTGIETEDGARLWAGHAGDPFWIEPDVLHAVGHAFREGTRIDLSGWDPGAATNLFAGHTVYSIVLEVPDAELLPVARQDRRIGVWSRTALATDAGGWRPINRFGLPMIQPLFTQFDEELGNALNGGRPADDLAAHGKVLTDRVAGVVAAYGTSADPRDYAETVVARMLPQIMPYVIGTSAVYGFAGFNGRALTDNAPDVMFSLASNTPVTLGIGRESVTSAPSDEFPYVPAPS